MSDINGNFEPGGTGTGPDPAAVKISSEVMVAAVVFLFMVVVFVFFLYLYAKYYLRPRHGRRSSARFVFAAADRAPRRGLDPAVLRSLPVTVYRAADFKEEGLECAVCLSELAEGEEARLLPTCNHGFHLECIDMWFHSHSTCPLCRSPVVGGKLNPDEEAPAPPADAAVEDSPAFPTNVLVWGSLVQVNSQEGPSSSAGVLAIEIPRRGMEGFPSPCSPLPSSRMAMEEAKSPASARFGPLRRLWSMGKRTAGASASPREGDVEQGLGGTPKSPANP